MQKKAYAGHRLLCERFGLHTAHDELKRSMRNKTRLTRASGFPAPACIHRMVSLKRSVKLGLLGPPSQHCHAFQSADVV
jgi:hypothetical protein